MEEEQAKAQENGSSKIDQKSAKPNEKVTTKQPKKKSEIAEKIRKFLRQKKLQHLKIRKMAIFVDSVYDFSRWLHGNGAG